MRTPKKTLDAGSKSGKVQTNGLVKPKLIVPPPMTYYAIGDIHGMAYQFEVMLTRILQDMLDTQQAFPDVKPNYTIVTLGDYVDRGPNSKSVMDSLIRLQKNPPANTRVICMRGNHEQMMYDARMFGDNTSIMHWRQNGGVETLKSYGLQYAHDLPDEHIKWINELPYIHIEESDKLIFCHAGIYPQWFPQVVEEELIWTRNRDFFASDDTKDDTYKSGWLNPELEGYMVIHGHTPTQYLGGGDQPTQDFRRINVDTGCGKGGPLTCVVIRPERKIGFFQESGGLVKP